MHPMRGIQVHSLVPQLRSHNAVWPGKKQSKQKKKLKKPFKVLAKSSCLSSPSVHWDTQCPGTSPSLSASCIAPKVGKISFFSFSRCNENNAHKYIFQTISLQIKHLHPKMLIFLSRIGLYITLSLSLTHSLSPFLFPSHFIFTKS